MEIEHACAVNLQYHGASNEIHWHLKLGIYLSMYGAALHHTTPIWCCAVWRDSRHYCECLHIKHVRSWSKIVGMCGTEQIEVRKLLFLNLLFWFERVVVLIVELESKFHKHLAQTIKVQNMDFF